MRTEYDFSQAKRAKDVPHLTALRAREAKARITILVDGDVLAAFRERATASGKGYQTLINEALRATLSPESAPVTVDALRRIIREELHAA